MQVYFAHHLDEYGQQSASSEEQSTIVAE